MSGKSAEREQAERDLAWARECLRLHHAQYEHLRDQEVRAQEHLDAVLEQEANVR